MTLMLSQFGRPSIAYNAEGVGSGGGDAAPAETPATPESVLFPAEANASATVDDKGATGEGVKPAGQSDDWKEYTPDPAKSEADNAAAKVEHDKTKPADKPADPADKVPEDGKYTLTMPEGVEVDQELLDAVGSDFKELGLTSGQAQKLADKFTSVMQKRAEDQTKGWGERIAKWADDAKTDKDIGGDKWNATVSNATRFTNAFGTPALKEYLNASGGGNHPELIRVFAKAGEMIREDNPASGGASGAGKPAEAAHLLFPNDAPKG